MIPCPFPTPPRITGPQRWRVALSLTLIYYPVLVYLDYSHINYTWGHLGRALLPGGLGAASILLIFWGWLYAVERLQNQLYYWLGEEFSLTMRWPALLLTVSSCLGVSVVFITLFAYIMDGLELLLAGTIWLAPHGSLAPASLALWHRSLDGYFFMLILSVFYLLANGRAQERLLAVVRHSEQLETEKAQVQLAALKNQVNPHFLFNSLTILSSLVHIDPDLSEKFIDQLARAYRYTLEQQQQDVVPLQTELSFIQSYVFLLKIRFHDKLNVVLDVPEATRTTYGIAPLTLQLLVENAVKHNAMSLARPLLVGITQEEDTLVVRNCLQHRLTTYDSTNVGLSNILNRYRLLTDRPVQVVETADVFEVRIPLLPV